MTLDSSHSKSPGSAAQDTTKWNVGFRYKDKTLLGFELKVTSRADIYMFVFERGHRRLHMSYHRDGRHHYIADRPNASSVSIQSDYPSGNWEPMESRKIAPLAVDGREEVGVTGWGIADVEGAQLNELIPSPQDIVVNRPQALRLGFCVNIIGPQACRGGDRIIERHYVDGPVRLEIEVFDWLAD
jgi:hypothetical protein